MSAEFLYEALYSSLPTEDKLVLAILGDSAEPEFGVVYPDHAFTAKAAGLSQDREMEIIRGFLERGILKTCAHPDALRIDASSVPKMEG